MPCETITRLPYNPQVGSIGWDNSLQLTRIEQRLEDIEKALRELLERQGVSHD